MQVIKIKGMQCEHCKKSVTEALSQIEGITKVEVKVEEGIATIESNREIEKEIIKGVIEEIGFEVGE